MSKYEYNQLFHYVFRLCFRPILLHNCQTFVASLEWVTDESFRLPEIVDQNECNKNCADSIYQITIIVQILVITKTCPRNKL